MMTVLLLRSGWFVVGLAVLMPTGIGPHAARHSAPALKPLVAAPACTSCTARHARLADVRAKPTEGTE
jgi:hypothetical protein